MGIIFNSHNFPTTFHLLPSLWILPPNLFSKSFLFFLSWYDFCPFSIHCPHCRYSTLAKTHLSISICLNYFNGTILPSIQPNLNFLILNSACLHGIGLSSLFSLLSLYPPSILGTSVDLLIISSSEYFMTHVSVKDPSLLNTVHTSATMAPTQYTKINGYVYIFYYVQINRDIWYCGLNCAPL
jgi:hypothetical protein